MIKENCSALFAPVFNTLHAWLPQLISKHVLLLTVSLRMNFVETCVSISDGVGTELKMSVIKFLWEWVGTEMIVRMCG